MSRRYPIDAGVCETCGMALLGAEDGSPRPHDCWVQWSGEPAPWPVMPARSAARVLGGVDPKVLEGLMNSPRLRGVKLVHVSDVGRPNAESRYMLNRADVAELARAMGADTPTP